MQHEYLTARQVAKMFKINVETVYDLAGTARIPATKVGGRWRFDASELRDWFKTHPGQPSIHQDA